MAQRSGVLQATFLLGALAGLLLALIAEELWPYSEDPTIDQYRAVRDFAREAFVREVSDAELCDMALHGMVAGLDNYSRYFDAQEAQALERETRGTYDGVGVVFRQPVIEGSVLFTLRDSPAARAGVRVGDRFLSIDGLALAGMNEEQLRARLGDADNGAMRVGVIGLDGEERELEITPTSLVDPSLRHVRMLDEERGIGYVSILSFSRETDAEFDLAFRFLRNRGMRALVLDLRRNFGGVLDSAVRIAGRFLSEGVIVSTEGRGTPVVHRADPGEASYEGTPLIVLVDSKSASASEVVAGALQDHRVAVIVGSPSYGKGTVQTIRNFDRWETRAKVTSSYYYSPSHRNFERGAAPGRDFGVLPDLSIPLTPAEQAAVHGFLSVYGAPLEAIPAIEAWERDTGLELRVPVPEDPQLEAALELFAGRRPGPQLVASGE